jgi:hypothetical protein
MADFWTPDELQNHLEDPDTGGTYGRIVRKGDPPEMVGHNENTHFRAGVDESSIAIKWDKTVRVLESVEEPGDDSKSTPQIHLSLAQDLAGNEQLEKL